MDSPTAANQYDASARNSPWNWSRHSSASSHGYYDDKYRSTAGPMRSPNGSFSDYGDFYSRATPPQDPPILTAEKTYAVGPLFNPRRHTTKKAKAAAAKTPQVTIAQRPPPATRASVPTTVTDSKVPAKESQKPASKLKRLFSRPVALPDGEQSSAAPRTATATTLLPSSVNTNSRQAPLVTRSAVVPTQTTRSSATISRQGRLTSPASGSGSSVTVDSGAARTLLPLTATHERQPRARSTASVLEVSKDASATQKSAKVSGNPKKNPQKAQAPIQVANEVRRVPTSLVPVPPTDSSQPLTSPASRTTLPLHPLPRVAAEANIEAHTRRVTIITPSTSLQDKPVVEQLAKPRTRAATLPAPTTGILRPTTPVAQAHHPPVESSALGDISNYVFPVEPEVIGKVRVQQGRSRVSAKPPTDVVPMSVIASRIPQGTTARSADVADMLAGYERSPDQPAFVERPRATATRTPTDVRSSGSPLVPTFLSAPAHDSMLVRVDSRDQSFNTSRTPLSQAGDLFPTQSMFSIPQELMRFARMNGTSFRRLGTPEDSSSGLHRTQELPRSRWAYIAHFASQYRKAVPNNTSLFSLKSHAQDRPSSVATLGSVMNSKAVRSSLTGLPRAVHTPGEKDNASEVDSIIGEIVDAQGHVLHAPTTSFLWNENNMSPDEDSLELRSVRSADTASQGSIELDVNTTFMRPRHVSFPKSDDASDGIRSEGDGSDRRNQAVRTRIAPPHHAGGDNDGGRRPFPLVRLVPPPSQPAPRFVPPPQMPPRTQPYTTSAASPRLAPATAAAAAPRRSPQPFPVEQPQPPPLPPKPPRQPPTQQPRETAPPNKEPAPGPSQGRFEFTPQWGPPLPQPTFVGVPNLGPPLTLRYWEKHFNMRLKDIPWVDSPNAKSLEIPASKAGHRRQKS